MKMFTATMFALLFLVTVGIANAQADLTQLQKLCSDALEDEYVMGEQYLGTEYLRSSDSEVMICGIKDASFGGFLLLESLTDVKYLNTYVIGDQPINLAQVKHLVDRYTSEDTFVTHIIVNPALTIDDFD